MPKGEEGHRFWERLVILEAKMSSVMTFQKWQMGILAAILLMVIKNWMK